MNTVPEHIACTRYPTVRLASRGGAIAMTDPRLHDELQQMFPGATPEEVENFMQTLRKIGKQLEPIGRQILPVIARAAPGAIQGAVTGMAAGPYGALAGAGIGAVTSILASPPRQPQAQPAAQPSRPAPAPSRPALPRTPATQLPQRRQQPRQAPGLPATSPNPGGAPPQVSQTAVAQLLALLSRPETMQALSALMMGRRGRQHIAVGQTQVPVAVFANALSEFAGEAADACRPCAASRRYAAQMHDAQIDITSPGAGAQALLHILLSGEPR